MLFLTSADVHLICFWLVLTCKLVKFSTHAFLSTTSRKDHFDSEEEDEEAPSCVTMTPDDLSQEGSGNPDVEMWTGSSGGGEEDLDLSAGPPSDGPTFRNGGPNHTRLGRPLDHQELRVAPTPPPAALT